MEGLTKLRWVFKRWWRRHRGMVLVFLAGLALVAVGIVCLYLSDARVHGWWQSTLDGLGVGFIVGGLVDVVAISLLNNFLTTEQARRESYREALPVLYNSLDPAGQAAGAETLLSRYKGSQFYPDVLEGLQEMAKQGR
jgi:hypothetical protein